MSDIAYVLATAAFFAVVALLRPTRFLMGTGLFLAVLAASVLGAAFLLAKVMYPLFEGRPPGGVRWLAPIEGGRRRSHGRHRRHARALRPDRDPHQLQPRRDVPRPDDRARRGRATVAHPIEIALSILLAGLTLVFLPVVVALPPMASYASASLSLVILAALFVALIPTLIGTEPGLGYRLTPSTALLTARTAPSTCSSRSPSRHRLQVDDP